MNKISLIFFLQFSCCFQHVLADFDFMTASILCEAETQGQNNGLIKKYIVAAEQLGKKLKAAGNLQAALSIDKEVYRATSEFDLTAKNLVAVPTELGQLQLIYLKAMSDANIRIAQSYVIKLNGLIRDFTEKDQLQDAVLARKQEEKILEKYNLVLIAEDATVSQLIDGQQIGMTDVKKGNIFAIKEIKDNANIVARVSDETDVLMPLSITHFRGQRQNETQMNGSDISPNDAKLLSSAANSGLRILSASYGFETKMANVTQRVESSMQGSRLALRVGNDTLGGDPFPGKSKVLNVKYMLGGEEKTATIEEGDTLRIPQDNFDSGGGQRSFPTASSVSSGSSYADGIQAQIAKIDNTIRDLIQKRQAISRTLEVNMGNVKDRERDSLIRNGNASVQAIDSQINDLNHQKADLQRKVR